jgi:hypothetical protein
MRLPDWKGMIMALAFAASSQFRGLAKLCAATAASDGIKGLKTITTQL